MGSDSQGQESKARADQDRATQIDDLDTPGLRPVLARAKYCARLPCPGDHNEDVRRRRDGQRHKLHGNAYLSHQSCCSCQKAHYGSPAKATGQGRLARRAGQDPAAGRPVAAAATAARPGDPHDDGGGSIILRHIVAAVNQLLLAQPLVVH